jgi:hypothetical protein
VMVLEGAIRVEPSKDGCESTGAGEFLVFSTPPTVPSLGYFRLWIKLMLGAAARDFTLR